MYQQKYACIKIFKQSHECLLKKSTYLQRSVSLAEVRREYSSLIN